MPGTCRIRDLLRGVGRFRNERTFSRLTFVRRLAVDLEIQLRPLRARERPFVLVTEFVGLGIAARAYLELYRRLVHDSRVDTLQPIVEPAQLILARFFCVE